MYIPCHPLCGFLKSLHYMLTPISTDQSAARDYAWALTISSCFLKRLNNLVELMRRYPTLTIIRSTTHLVFRELFLSYWRKVSRFLAKSYDRSGFHLMKRLTKVISRRFSVVSESKGARLRQQLRSKLLQRALTNSSQSAKQGVMPRA